ncbi:hypothetical protein EDB92DRAFT_2113423 [Lactarius akahatsu]|uniref:DUF6535 domain-containing protein n=1 Tax=Lactarius akahatsu TaxID=416441 RepID=A0AAD4LJG9_9AGAM|nr:hypothetical protein EDB92DRAFT_2113423 [Lactarius akahatsu]
MPRRARHTGDPERGEQLPLVELEGEPRPETPGRRLDLNAGGGSTINSSNGPEAQSRHRDFDDGANALWSLYGKEAQAHDEAIFQGLSADMSGIPTFAALFAGVLTSFLVDGLHKLQPDRADQSVFYQRQSVEILFNISQQIASVAPDVITPTPPPLYPVFIPSSSDIQMNTYWLIGLRYDHPLKRARFRQFFFEGARSMRVLASSATLLIRFSLAVFFLGLADYIIGISSYQVANDITIEIIIPTIAFTIIPFSGALLIFLFIMLVPLWNLKSPDKSLLSWPIFFLMQKFKRPYFGNPPLSKEPTPASMEAYQELMVMEETDERKGRDTRALRWLIDRAVVTAEMEPLVLAIPGSFNTECGQEVWREVTSQARNTLRPPTGPSTTGGQVSPMPHPPGQLDGAAVDTISQCMRYMFEACHDRNYFKNARRRRMRACVEAAASLVCLIGYPLDLFGEVGKVVSEMGQIENVNSPTTTSDPSFIIRWTCLSLVDIKRILGSNQLKVLAGNAVNGLARFQSEDSENGQPDEAGAQGIDGCLKAAWKRVEDLRRAFEPWTQKKTREQVEQILLTHGQQISELERVKSEADGLADVDREVSVYQDAMDDATHRLTQQLPGVSFDVLHQSQSFLIGDTLNTSVTASAAVTPQLIFPGQQLQALAGLGLQLREVLGGQVEGYEEVLESLKSVDKVPVSLRWPNGLMKRQMWRLQDLHDGGGLGFSIELFFLSLRRLLSISSLDESNSAFYTGTFKVIISHWMEGKESPGTHRILLNIICDLIIPGRGTFSDFSYPEPITTTLLDTVGNMLQGYVGPDEDIRSAVREIESADPDSDIRDAVREIADVEPIRMDRKELQCKALAAFRRFRNNPGYLEHVVVDPVG